jgi:long-subunit acyl-CoA synthetase (AMP-forming)
MVAVKEEEVLINKMSMNAECKERFTGKITRKMLENVGLNSRPDKWRIKNSLKKWFAKPKRNRICKNKMEELEHRKALNLR